MPSPSALPAGDRAGHTAQACPCCGGNRSWRWGRTKRGLQRWQCRACSRTFTKATGTPLARIRSPEAFAVVLDDMLKEVPRSCRQLAAALGRHRMTVWRRRNRIAGALALRAGIAVDDLKDGARVILRESRKASREWVAHARQPLRHPAPDRRRWIDYRLGRLPLPAPMTPHLLAIVLTPSGRAIAGRPGDPSWPAAADATVPAPGPTASGAAAPGERTPDIGTSAGRRRGPVADTIPDTPTGRGDAVARFTRFMTPFRGPATRHLDGYTAWFSARQGGTAKERRRRLWASLLG